MESFTYCQANRTRVEVRTVRRSTVARSAMESLTNCKANRTKVGVRRDIAGPGMYSHTACQVRVKAVRWDASRPGMDSSHTICQANSTRAVGIRTVRRGTVAPGM